MGFFSSSLYKPFFLAHRLKSIYLCHWVKISKTFLNPFLTVNHSQHRNSSAVFFFFLLGQLSSCILFYGNKRHLCYPWGKRASRSGELSTLRRTVERGHLAPEKWHNLPQLPIWLVAPHPVVLMPSLTFCPWLGLKHPGMSSLWELHGHQKWKSLSHVQLFVTPLDYTVHGIF